MCLSIKILKFPSWKSCSRGQIGFLQELGKQGEEGGREEERENLKKNLHSKMPAYGLEFT